MVFLYLNSDQMGQGDPELGKKLLESFLNELAQSETQVDMIGCVNSAINLTTEKSPALESLKSLEQKGARIATCGTCLEFNQKKDQLLIGEIGSMKDTVHIMANAAKIIRPT